MQNLNKPLFSSHYLAFHLPESPEWQLDPSPIFEQLKSLYLAKKALLSSLNEAQTEEEFIKPVLDILGFSYTVQVVTKGKGRAERPDYALFANNEQKSAALLNQNNESVFYQQVLVIAEAKYWERPLSKVSSNDQRDIYKNTNPSFQIASYLIGTGANWGILTNGREWRLYYRLASSTATEFYPIDLVELLESDNLEGFKYFWLFFRREAFETDVQGRNFLERVRDGSTTYATRVGNELKNLVFEQIFSGLAGGFVADITRRGHTINANYIYEATLSFLYKLLFLFYAEARNLLPVDQDYRDYSLTAIAQDIAVGIEQKRVWSRNVPKIYDALICLFQVIDRGDANLEVPRYNGGLFHFEEFNGDINLDFESNDFLRKYHLSDAVLAPMIDKLARFEGQAIDYSFLGVRQLGSIYEGLLEYRLVIDNAATGEVHLENDKGERKASGSYYTPDYIVKYIVGHTLKPILESREQQFKVLMAQMSELQQQKNDKRLSLESLRDLDRQLGILERQAQTILLDIKVCDPAMGSGHFLVEAVDFLTDELIKILNVYPDQNPILKMLDQMRNSIIENLQSQGIKLDPSRLEPTQLLQRVVMKRCIYGVDLNPMAVELAKVSLWLHSFTIGAPLSFLDHHLRCGNSLIGTTAREAELAMSQEKNGNAVQFNLLTGPFVGLLSAAEIMRGVSVLSDATFAEVEQSERLFKQFDAAAKPFKQLLDVYVSQFFGVKQGKNLLARLGKNLINPNTSTMNKEDLKVLEASRKLYEEKHFFHWDLEFPEVFIDLDNANWSENSGFDAVIGNPPYDELSEDERKNVLEEIIFFKSISKFAFSLGNRINIYRLFIAQALDILKNRGNHGFIVPLSLLADQFTFNLRKHLLENTQINLIEQFPQKDDPHDRIFFDAKLSTCVYVISKKLPGQKHRVFIRNHPGRIIIDDSPSYQTLQSDFLNFDQTNLSIPGLNENSWNFILKLANNQQLIKLGNFASASPGELMINSSFKKYLSDQKLGEEAIRGSHIGRYVIVEPKQGESIFFNRDLYLKEHPNSKKAFSHQSKRVIYQRYAAIDNYRRLIATILPENYFCSHTTGYLLNIKDYALGFLASLLNSKILEWRFSLTSTNNNINGYEIESLPIPKINFTTNSDRRQQGLENLINLYQTYQSNFDLTYILNQCQQHLNQQPEEADIVHDFLAYLAEQMIALNQQKQTEIKGFLEWLESLIGCPIANLKNKSKIQNYLGDYSKQTTLDPALDLDGLIAILNQNKKLLKIDPSSRQDHTRIKTEYQNSLNTLLPIKTQLKNCDRLIDEIVYQLYGLTAEEKAIIENSMAK